MKLTFDDLCAQIVGEDIMSATKLQQPAVQKPGTTTNQAPQPTPAAQQNQQLGDEDLLKLLQQKLADEKFKQALLQLVNPSQQNAIK